MSLVLGLVLGLGLLLVVSPVLWPRTADAPARSTPRSVLLMRDRLVQAGLDGTSPQAVAAVSAIVAVAAFAVAFAVFPVVALAVVVGSVALVAPSVVITARARSRRASQRDVWPDLVDHLVSAVRSGLALPDSLVTLGHAGPVGIRPPFVAFERTLRATGDFGLGLDELKDRLADPVADRVLETLRMSREVGGSELTTVLRGLASYLREEAAVRSEIEARQSWVTSAARLGIAAPWIILLLLSTRPEAAVAYNTPTGFVLIVGGLLVSVVAYRIMVRIGRLPEEQRWFQ
jgi:tight adherence protein B